jgi:hypothetical protein
VPMILEDDGWKAIPCCDADPADIMVFWDNDAATGSPTHSGIIATTSTTTTSEGTRVNEDQATLRQKLGFWSPPEHRPHEDEPGPPIPPISMRGVVTLSWQETATLASLRKKYPDENWGPSYGKYRCFRHPGRGKNKHDHKCCIRGEHELMLKGKHIK